MAKDTDGVPEPAMPVQRLQYPDGDYSADDVKPLDTFLRSDGCVVPQAAIRQDDGRS